MRISRLVQQICGNNKKEGSVGDKSTKIFRKLDDTIETSSSLKTAIQVEKIQDGRQFQKDSQIQKTINRFYCDDKKRF